MTSIDPHHAPAEVLRASQGNIRSLHLAREKSAVPAAPPLCQVHMLLLLLLLGPQCVWFPCGCAVTIASKPGVHWLCGGLLVLVLSLPWKDM